MAYGFNGHIGIGKETNWGSGVAATDYLEALNESITVSLDRFEYKNIHGSLAEPDDIAGINRVAGNIAFAGHPIPLGYFLESVLYQSTATDVLSGFLYTHTYKTSTGDFNADCPVQPYSFEIHRDVTTSIRYAGAVVTQLDLNVTPNQELRCTATILARNAASIAKTTPTFPSSSSKPFTFDTASVQIGGSSTTKVEALTISIQNQLDGIPVLNNSTDVGKIRRTGFQTVSVNGTLDFTSLDEYDDFIAQTEQAFKVSFSKASSFALVIDIPRMVYTSMPLGIGGRERITVDFEGKGFYLTSSATAIQIDLTNTTAAY